ncbi:hypothetical protein [Brevundimonas diminuta]|uniref:Uncharacterized protein n=1 Tax=Brevundimonas diminuta TaxID=293 RepID=A0A2X1B626_BREDI|nr:hypothetical protein [Brevundimonas diminuta]SPU46284.1 Uncharacterised protein [Brevundimonas diminuta]
MSHIDDLPENLAATFDILASAASELQDPWWVFGGAGMACQACRNGTCRMSTS